MAEIVLDFREVETDEDKGNFIVFLCFLCREKKHVVTWVSLSDYRTINHQGLEIFAIGDNLVDRGCDIVGGGILRITRNGVQELRESRGHGSVDYQILNQILDKFDELRRKGQI